MLTILASVWWIVGLSIQSSYGLDILKFTETLETVSQASLPVEVLRGLGYWFFYGRDKIGPWIEPSVRYTQDIWLLAVSYGLPMLALLGAALVRWKHRAFFVFVTLIGVAVSVGANPYDDPSVLGRLFKGFAEASDFGLALRSTGRAVPLVALGLAVLLGLGVNAVAGAFAERRVPVVGLVVAGIVIVLALVNVPARFDGSYYGENLQRDEDIPSYWSDAIAALDAGPHDTRVLEMPGADFASYRWGDTVDPITPGLTDRPYVARELVPWGSPASADLLNALDRRLQEGVLEPSAHRAHRPPHERRRRRLPRRPRDRPLRPRAGGAGLAAPHQPVGGQGAGHADRVRHEPRSAAPPLAGRRDRARAAAERARTRRR